MPATALNHFDQDVARARAIVAHADPLPRSNAAEQMLRSDRLVAAAECLLLPQEDDPPGAFCEPMPH